MFSYLYPLSPSLLLLWHLLVPLSRHFYHSPLRSRSRSFLSSILYRVFYGVSVFRFLLSLFSFIKVSFFLLALAYIIYLFYYLWRWFGIYIDTHGYLWISRLLKSSSRFVVLALKFLSHRCLPPRPSSLNALR